MKKSLKAISITLAMAMAFTVTPSITTKNNTLFTVEAATTKSNVKYTLKDGVLTIYHCRHCKKDWRLCF